MFEFQSLPSSKAQDVDELFEYKEGIRFTAYKNEDENTFYQSLDQQLRMLENENKIETEKLTVIEQAANELTFAIEEKEDMLRRIKWLWLLHETRGGLNALQTREEVSTVKYALSEVQASPLKTQLMTELDQLAQSLPTKERSFKDQLMEMAFEQAGEDFINLGKVGRTFIIERLLAEGSTTVEAIQIETDRLNEIVASLCATTDAAEFLAQIEQLPLTSYAKILPHRREALIHRLMKENDWHDLLALDHKISQIDRKLAKEEVVQKAQELSGKPTATIEARTILSK